MFSRSKFLKILPKQETLCLTVHMYNFRLCYKQEMQLEVECFIKAGKYNGKLYILFHNCKWWPTSDFHITLQYIETLLWKNICKWTRILLPLLGETMADRVWFILIRSWVCSQLFLFLFERSHIDWPTSTFFETLGMPPIEAPLLTPSCKIKTNVHPWISPL